MIRRAIKEAKSVLQEYKTNDPVELCEKIGVIVLEKQLPDLIFGLAYAPLGQPFVVLQPELEPPFRNFVIAHELGHHLLHPNVVTFFVEENTFFRLGKIEWEAHLFAICILSKSAERLDIPSLAAVGIPPEISYRLMDDPTCKKYFLEEFAWQPEESPREEISGRM
jgi:Zn-dependent peptidase ImmA (M78 family)